MPKGVLAYRTKGVLLRLQAGEVPEPYGTLLYLHGKLGSARIARAELAEMRVSDVAIDAGGVHLTRANGQRVTLPPNAVAQLQKYLRGHLTRQDTEWLFPLPRDPSKPANEVVAKRYLRRLLDSPGPQE